MASLKFNAKTKAPTTVPLPASTIKELIELTLTTLTMDDPEQAEALREALTAAFADVKMPAPAPTTSASADAELKRENTRLQQEVKDLKRQLETAAAAAPKKANAYSLLVSVVATMAKDKSAKVRDLEVTPVVDPVYATGSASAKTWAETQAKLAADSLEVTSTPMPLGELYDMLAPHVTNGMALAGVLNGFLNAEDKARVAAEADPASKKKSTSPSGNKFSSFMTFCKHVKTAGTAQNRALATLNASAPGDKAGVHYAKVLAAEKTIELGTEVSVSKLYNDIHSVLNQTAQSASLLWALLSESERSRLLAL